MTEPLTPLSILRTLCSTCNQRHLNQVSRGGLGSTRPGAGITPSLLLPSLGPSFQHGENITFVMESHVAEQEEMFRGPKYIFHSFMERLWAYLTIQQLLEQMWVNTSSRGPPGGHPRPQHLPRLFTGRAGTAGTGISWAGRLEVVVTPEGSGREGDSEHLGACRATGLLYLQGLCVRC